MRCSRSILTCALALELAALAAEVDLKRLPPPAAKKGVSYAKDIRLLLEASCFRCHGEDRPKAGLRLDSLEALLKGGEDGKVVVPGRSDQSPLVIAVSQLDPEKAMPPKPGAGRSGQRPPGSPPPSAGAPPPGGGGRGYGAPPKPLTAEQVGLIRAWIDQGAK